MAVNSVDYIGLASSASPNTDRGPSSQIWGHCPWAELREHPERGQTFFDDFQVTPAIDASGGAVTTGFSPYALYAYTGGTLTDGGLEGGVLVLGSDGDNEGVALGSVDQSYRITTTSTLALNKKLWFECRVAVSSVAATKNDVFVGLNSVKPAAGIPITTTDDTLYATQSCIGFHRRGTADPDDFSVVYQLSGSSAVYPTNLTTPVVSATGSAVAAATFYKLGFVFDPDAPMTQITAASTGQTVNTVKQALITFYVNGIKTAAFLTSTNVQGVAFPTAFMSPTIAIMNQTGSTPGTVSIDWWRCAQLANS